MQRTITFPDRAMWIRIATDFVIVHACMITALPLAMLYHTALGHYADAVGLLHDFRHNYLMHFSPLSFIFPAGFFLAGFYDRARGYRRRYKLIAISRGVGITVLTFFFANSVLLRNDLMSRSIVLVFCVLVLVAVPLARLTKTFILNHLTSSAERSPSEVVQPLVLVVGGAGYIGSMLVRMLLGKHYRVRVLDNLVYGDAAIRELLGTPGFELQVGDCRNIQTVVAAVKGANAVIHLAAIVGDPACDLDRQTALEINFAATRMLMEIAKGHGIKRFVFASSCSVYGATDLLMDESSPVEPVSLYGETKVQSEQALLDASSQDFQPTILRFATVFGLSHRPRFDLVVNLLTAKAYQDHVITIFNGEQWRPFIHVRDVSRAIMEVLAAPLTTVGGQIYNVGDSRQNWTLANIAQKVGEIILGTSVLHVDNADRRNYRVSFDKIKAQLGFVCQVSVEEGIRELKAAFENGNITDYSNRAYNNQKHLSVAGSPGHTSTVDVHVMAAFAAASGLGHQGQMIPPGVAVNLQPANGISRS